MPKLGQAERAVRSFRKPIERALRCITPAWPVQIHPRTDAWALDFGPVKLRAARPGDVHLVIGHGYRLVQETARPWHVSTTGYVYTILDADESELCSWHWHPHIPDQPWPHLHIKQHRQLAKVHLPTSRVSIESVIRMLIDDLGVPPAADRAHDYGQVLDAGERAFIEHRRWHVAGPGDGSVQ